MGLINWLSKKLSGGAVSISGDGWANDDEMMMAYQEACYRDMALWTGIDLIAKSISKCEFKEYAKGKEVQGAEWYLWNVEPNRNQNSSAFLRELVSKLFYTGECLIIGHNNQLLIADSFVRTPYVLYDDIFEQVTVKDFTFDKKFSGSEVLYWNINSLGNSKSVQSVIKAVAEPYAKLLAYGMKSYQNSRGTKAIFKYDALPPNIDAENASDWITKQVEKYSKFLKSDSGVAPMGNGTSFEAFDRKSTYSNETTRDIRSMIDDISDFTAKAFGIPPALLRGDVQGVSDALDQYLTFCLDPLADMLREEIVRKRIGYSELKKGRNIIIDTKQVKHIDVISVSDKLEKLISSAIYSVNDVLKMLGEPTINEPWADEHHMTKNFSSIQDILKGGE